MGGFLNLKINCYDYDPKKSKIYTLEKKEEVKQDGDVDDENHSNKIILTNPFKLGVNVPDVND